MPNGHLCTKTRLIRATGLRWHVEALHERKLRVL